jgi:hypothetical protein
MWRDSGTVGGLVVGAVERKIYVRTILSSLIGAGMLWLDLAVFYPVYPSRGGLRRLMVYSTHVHARRLIAVDPAVVVRCVA